MVVPSTQACQAKLAVMRWKTARRQDEMTAQCSEQATTSKSHQQLRSTTTLLFKSRIIDLISGKLCSRRAKIGSQFPQWSFWRWWWLCLVVPVITHFSFKTEIFSQRHKLLSLRRENSSPVLSFHSIVFPSHSFVCLWDRGGDWGEGASQMPGLPQLLSHSPWYNKERKPAQDDPWPANSQQKPSLC